MKQTRLIMGMPITVEIVDSTAIEKSIEKAFSYFQYIDDTFSTYKPESEISAINRGALKENEYSDDMKTIFALAEETKISTNGYFDIRTQDGSYDPSGIVKGWAIHNVGKLLKDEGYENFYVDAGGDIESHGKNSKGGDWSVGIQNPFNKKEIIKIIYPRGKGVATSGTYIRGDHIHNPKENNTPITEIVSLTVIGPNVYEADRFATGAFAMGKEGVKFIEQLDGFEAYMINKEGIATMTSGFEFYTKPHA